MNFSDGTAVKFVNSCLEKRKTNQKLYAFASIVLKIVHD